MSLERVLARARLILVAGCAVAASLDLFAPAHAHAAVAALAGYGVWSVGISIALQTVARVSRREQRVISAIELAGAAAIATISLDTSTSTLILFVMIANAFRDGSRGAAVSTTAIGATLIGSRVIMFAAGGIGAPLSVFAIRLAYLCVTGLVVGSIAERQRQRIAEAEAVASALGCVRDARTYVRAVAAVADQLTQLFDARSVVVSIASPDGDRYCWQVLRADGLPPEIRSIDASRDPADHAAPVGPDPQTTLFFRDEKRRGVSCIGAAPMVAHPRLAPTAEFWRLLDCACVLEHCVALEGGWRVRQYLVDPGETRPAAAAVRLLHALDLEIVPALLTLFLSRRLRSQVLARERTRFARELHDRVVQGLVGLEIQVTVLARRASARPVLQSLEEIQRHLRQQVDDVRELMRHFRPLRLRATDVPPYIESLVRRFEQRTGIRARFECEVDRVVLMPHACGEFVRLIEEALVNVHKHSGATEVVVALKRGARSLDLTVVDNGHGFEFDGRSAAYAMPPHERPRVIEERASAIGALLSIESSPGVGARLDVTFPYAS